MRTLADFVRQEPFFVIAHRGDSGHAPENTLGAISQAITLGSAMIEIDVQLTKDQELVVFHDPVLGRTSNGSGHVRNFTFKQLQQLDAGSWFNEKFSEEKIPNLMQVLNLVKGHTYLNIEIKPTSHDPFSIEAAELLIDTIIATDMAPYTVFASFDHGILQRIKEIRRFLHTCALNVPGDTRLPSQVVNSCGADAYGCSVQELTEKRATDTKEHRIPWGVYTVNSKSELDLALQHGVQAVVTNFPGEISKEYHSREQ